MKIFYIAFIYFLSLSVAHTQNTAYVRVAGSGFIDNLEKVSSGGYITTGQDSNYKVQVIRWDENFNPLWKYKFTDSKLIGFPQKIAEANDGSFFYMSSSTENSGCTFVAKFSSNGNILWQKKYYLAAGNMNSESFSKAAGTDNGFLFGGGQCTLSNYIVKCNGNGDIDWQKQYVYPLSTGVITCWSIIPEGSGYVVSSGYNINSLLTMKIDGSGNITSHSDYTYTGMQILPSRIIKLNSTGGYAILGNYNSSNDNKTEFTAFFDSGLNLLSFNELTVTYTQFILWDITAVNNGNEVVLNGSIIDGTGFKAAMIKLSGNGNLVWQKMASGNSSLSNKNVEFRGITTSGNYTVSAGFGYNEGGVLARIDDNGNGLCNDVPFNLVNVHRTLTAQSQSITPVAATALSAPVSYTGTTAVYTTKEILCGNIGAITDMTVSQPVSFYPNPAESMIYIQRERNCELLIEICNLNGQVLEKSILPAYQSEIQTDFLAPGCYIIKVKEYSEPGGVSILRLVKL